MQSCLPKDSRQIRPVLTQIHDKNVVVTEIQNLMFPEEADYIRSKALNIGFDDSTVVSSKGSSEKDPRRTSQTSFLPKHEDDVIDCIGRRISTIAGQPHTHMEPMQVTDYKNKQEYRAHHDYFGVSGGPERTMTVFAYLHSVDCDTGACGGATAFHNLKKDDGSHLRIYPKPGNAVMWSNRTATGGLNADTLHSGEKLTCVSAHKVGLNAWFRDAAW